MESWNASATLQRLIARDSYRPPTPAVLDAIAAIVGPAEPLGPGTVLAVDTSRDVLLFVDGTVEVLHEELADPAMEAPCLVGLLEFVGGYDGPVGVRAVTEARFFRLKYRDKTFDRVVHEVPWVENFVRLFYQLELGRVYAEKMELERHLSDYFLPGTAGMVPGPYMSDQVTMTIFVMEGDPKQVAGLLPPGLFDPPWSAARYLVVASRIKDMRACHAIGAGREFDYNETAFFIPCLHVPFGPGAYCHSVFPDNYLAISIGRELYGFPKRFGETLFKEDQREIDFALAGGQAARMTWAGTEAISCKQYFEEILAQIIGARRLAGRARKAVGLYLDSVNRGWLKELWPAIPVYMRHQVPDVASPGERRVVPVKDVLVRVPFQIFGLRCFERLVQPEVAFRPSELPFQGHCVAGWRLQLGIRLEEQQVVWRHFGLINDVRAVLRRLDRRRQRIEVLLRLREPPEYLTPYLQSPDAVVAPPPDPDGTNNGTREMTPPQFMDGEEGDPLDRARA